MVIGCGDNNIIEFGEWVYVDLVGLFCLKKNGKEVVLIDNLKYYFVVWEVRRRLLFVVMINGKNDVL